MKPHFYLYCIALQLTIVPAAHAYSTADLNKLISTNKCVGCDLSGADLSRKQLVNADLQAANLVGAKLTSTNLTGAKLGGANLTGADLSNTNLSQAFLQAVSAIDVNFVGTNLTNTDLTYANLVNTNFSRAILRNTNLSSANLALSDFTGANLSTLNLTDANLSGAKGATPAPSTVEQQQNSTVNGTRDRQIKPNVEETAPIFRRRPVYRIPADLGKPQRLVPGGTRVVAPHGTNE
jgi:Pentapeptide repeats (8 copies)/Pentapeptide repeats (9 copies)